MGSILLAVNDIFFANYKGTIFFCRAKVQFSVLTVYLFRFSVRLYNNVAKIFGAEGVLRRRLEKLEGKMVYTTCGKCSVYYTSRVVYFFEKSFLRAKIVPKVCGIRRGIFLLYKDKNRSIGVERNSSVGKASPPTTSECCG